MIRFRLAFAARMKVRIIGAGAVIVTLLGAGTAFAESAGMDGGRIVYVHNMSVLPAKVVKSDIVAFQRALDQRFAPVWAVDAHLVYLPARMKPSPDAWTITLSNDIRPDGALGYHGWNGLAPTASVFVLASRSSGRSWTIAFTHELWEILTDPSDNRGEQATGSCWYALEVADPVEADGYGFTVPNAKGTPTLISDFVLESWFVPGAAGPYDFTHAVSAPFQVLPAGSAMRFESNGSGDCSRVP